MLWAVRESIGPMGFPERGKLGGIGNHKEEPVNILTAWAFLMTTNRSSSNAVGKYLGQNNKIGSYESAEPCGVSPELQNNC